MAQTYEAARKQASDILSNASPQPLPLTRRSSADERGKRRTKLARDTESTKSSITSGAAPPARRSRARSARSSTSSFGLICCSQFSSRSLKFGN